MTKLTKAGAACEREFDRQWPNLDTQDQLDWNAIATAAISAEREDVTEDENKLSPTHLDGDYPADRDEREHCARVEQTFIRNVVNGFWPTGLFIETLLRERAAVRAECQREDVTEDERAHCWTEACGLVYEGRASVHDVADRIERERAAIRAECQREIERLQDIEMEVDSWKDSLRESQPERDALRERCAGLESQLAAVKDELAKASRIYTRDELLMSEQANGFTLESLLAERDTLKQALAAVTKVSRTVIQCANAAEIETLCGDEEMALNDAVCALESMLNEVPK